MDPAATGSRHYWKSTFYIWCAGNTVRQVVSLKADVLRCLYAAEAAFIQEFGQPIWPKSFELRSEFADAGVFVGLVVATLDYSTDHTNP